ncbi:MAG: DUF342 domain-containing protein [Deltaproteobacteria bacterium]|nr:DUF342 domain-containing protein [Deltaproteobacteria bacterium]
MMMKYRAYIRSKNRNDALNQGAHKLGVDSSLVKIFEEDGDNFIISLIDAPGEFEIETRDDKMAAVLRTITPPSGKGLPVTFEDIEKALSNMGITHGIERDIILAAVKEVKESGKIKRNIVIAKGVPPQKGRNAAIELKVGRDAENKDQKAASIVKPGQVIAVKIPAEPGKPGIDILGGEAPSIPGDDMDFLPGENVIIRDNKYISGAYGAARETWQGISVNDYVKVSKDRLHVEMMLFPVLSDNSSLSVDDIENILKARGIKTGINTELIKAALEKGKPVEDFRVAEAVHARDGVDAKIEFLFRINGEDPE